MKTIRNWNDLEPYGIDALTGEACAYGYRLLCDLTDKGIKLVQECFGFPVLPESSMTEAWNSKGKRSMMMPREMLTPLAVFAMWSVNCKQVYITYDGIVYGIEGTDSDEMVKDFVRFNQGHYCEECRRYGAGGGIALQYSNPGYSRNLHQMSGRTA